MRRVGSVLLLVVALGQGAFAHDETCAAVYSETAHAAQVFLKSLTPEQRAAATFAMDHAERVNWGFIPRERKGLPYKSMTAAQRPLAQAFLQAIMSQRGLLQVEQIIDLENVLREMGGNPAVRDPELYFFSFFGEPVAGKPWGFRFEGHHISINGAVAGCARITVTPTFLGANPAEVREGTRKGRRALAVEEDLGRQLAKSLASEQAKVAVIPGDAPAEIITGTERHVSSLEPMGLSAARMTAAQQETLRNLVRHYLERYRIHVAKAEWDEIERAGWDKVYFAWAGGIEPGMPHYYRVQGPTFLLEYDNTQNNANHIHTVWRNFKQDFGDDALKRHYEESHRP
jgi:hypothetical protein